MLIGVFLGQELAYSSDISCLRVPIEPGTTYTRLQKVMSNQDNERSIASDVLPENNIVPENKIVLAKIPFNANGTVDKKQLENLPIIKKVMSEVKEGNFKQAKSTLEDWMKFNRSETVEFKFKYLEEKHGTLNKEVDIKQMPLIVSSNVSLDKNGVSLVFTNGWGLTRKITISKPNESVEIELSREASKVFDFGGYETQAEGSLGFNAFLGNKGANLAEMTNIGLPVPPGFTIVSDDLKRMIREEKVPGYLWNEIEKGITRVEKKAANFTNAPLKYADPNNLLLLAVRSGAYKSSPGRYLTINNVGLHQSNLNAYSEVIKNPYKARLDYIRYIYDYIFDIDKKKEESNYFYTLLYESKFGDDYINRNYKNLKEVGSLEEVDTLVLDAEKKYKELTGRDFPEPLMQLRETIIAVAKSYDKNLNGSAVNVQWQVLGSIQDGKSLSGVLFSRNPYNGEKELVGNYEFGNEGSYIVKPKLTRELEDALASANRSNENNYSSLEPLLPDVYKELKLDVEKAEKHFGTIQDMEIVVSAGKLYFVQSRDNFNSMTPLAQTRILVDLAAENAIAEGKAIEKISLSDLEWIKYYLEQKVVKETSKSKAIGMGIPMFPGIVTAAVHIGDPGYVGVKEGSIIIVKSPVERAHGGDLFYNFSYEHVFDRGVKGILAAMGGFADHASIIIRNQNRRIPYVIWNQGFLTDNRFETLDSKE